MSLDRKIERKKIKLALKQANKNSNNEMVPSKPPTHKLDPNMSITELYIKTGWIILANNKGHVWTPHEKQLDGLHSHSSHMHIFYDTFLYWMTKNKYSIDDPDAPLKTEEIANKNNYFYVILWPQNANYRIEGPGRGLNRKVVVIRNVNRSGNPTPLFNKLKRMSNNDELPPSEFKFDKKNPTLGHGISVYKPFEVVVDTGSLNFFR